MIQPQPRDLRRFADVLWLRTGVPMTVRFVEPGDIELLRRYFEALSPGSRYYRFLGATRGPPPSEFEKMIRSGDAGHFAVLAEVEAGEGGTIIAEARYALAGESQAVEFGISVADGWRRRGVGSALLSNLECRAAVLGADGIFGDALNTNREMLGLARSRGYRLARPPGDWTQVRFEKDVLVASGRPCVKSSGMMPLLAAAG